MPRRARKIDKREIATDPKYGDPLLGRFINKIMLMGKKSIAYQIMYDSIEIVGEKSKDDPIKVLKKAVDNIRPSVEVKSRRVGGATYQVPIEVRQGRGEALAVQWLIGFARNRAGHSMEEKLAEEIMEAYAGKGSAMKKKEDVHKMAEANKAFAHYRW